MDWRLLHAHSKFLFIHTSAQKGMVCRSSIDCLGGCTELRREPYLEGTDNFILFFSHLQYLQRFASLENIDLIFL